MCAFKTPRLYVANTIISGPQHIFSGMRKATPCDNNPPDRCGHCHTHIFVVIYGYFYSIFFFKNSFNF